MKKSGFSFGIVLFIFSFFLFNTDVYAAQELTCLYEKQGKSFLNVDKVMLQQDSDGKITIYKNKRDADYTGKMTEKDSAGAGAAGKTNGSYKQGDEYNDYSDWYTNTNEVVYDSSLDKIKDKDGHFTKCPSSKSTKKNGLGQVTFYGNNDGDEKLESHSDKVETVETNRKATVQASQQLTIDMKFTKITISSCEDLFKDADDLLSLVKSGITIVKIAVPLILIVMGTMDFAQAIFASSEDGIKKAQSKFTKRVIIAVVIFLIPSVLKAILSIAHSIWPIVDATLCGII